VTVEPDQHIVIHPRRNKREKTLPENGILLVNPSEASECIGRLRDSGGDSRFLFNSGLVVIGEPRYFVAGPAIGAPMAALTLEKLIALGAKRVILFGWCGAISENLQVGDILVTKEARSGEGTSRYYFADAAVGPDTQLCGQVVKVLEKNGLSIHQGCVWSTDAVYREDRRMLKKLRLHEGVDAIDMEFSALCAVAKYRKIQFTAVLVVSDELWGDSWRPGFSKKFFIEQKQQALRHLLDHIGRLGEK
jgi:uridine phosphorylase